MPRLRKPPLSEEVSDTSKPSGNGSSVPRDAKGRVLEGAVLNPRGRTPGSKDRITRAFLADLEAAWEKHGPQVLARLAKKDPRSFVYAALALVPKAMEVDATRRIYRMRDTPLSPSEWRAKHEGVTIQDIPKPNGGETPH